MKKITVLLLALALGISFAGCHKKQQALEEMQQPMSPEDLNRIKTETKAQGTSSEAAAPQATVVSTTEGKLEPLPPTGPYQPTAKEIQLALKNAGFYSGTIDGKLGPKSKMAIEEFQKAHGLTADGKVGPRTWAALSQYVNAQSTATAPRSPAAGD